MRWLTNSWCWLVVIGGMLWMHVGKLVLRSRRGLSGP